ncbi:MAG: ABC transporter permease [Candidatus Heimdallarchaeota archaeon]
MTTQQSDIKESKTSFKIIFGVYLKTGKRRIVTSVITGAIIFLVLTTFFMTWYSLRYDSFYNYIDQNHEWSKDEKISVFGTEYIYDSYSIGENYLNSAITEVTGKLDELVPGIRENYTAGMRFNIYTNSTGGEIITNDLISLDNSSTQVLSTCLTEGRMPENYTEIVYYQKDSTTNITLNDVIPFQAIGYSFDFTEKMLNCTIVGIVKNVENTLHQKGISIDFLVDPDAYFYYEDASDNEQFFTNPDYMNDVINYYPQISSTFSAGLDFDYQISINHIKNIRQITEKIIEFQRSFYDFNYLPGYYVVFCEDLVGAFRNFETIWLKQTISVFASSLPLLFLFGVIIVETFNIGSFEQESKFRLLKTHGLEFKTLRKMLILENFITASTSLLGGFSLGLLVGFLVFLKLDISQEVSYIAAAIEPFIVLGLVVLFLGFFIFGLVIQYIHAKRTSETATEQYKGTRKGKRRKLLRKIFGASEVIFLIPGLILSAIGIIGFLTIGAATPFDSGANPVTTALMWFLITFGILFILTSLFLFISRLLKLIWTALGNKIWKTTKSYFALTLKHLAIYNKNYQRMVLAMFILGLGVTPGFIISKSIDNHHSLEANLTVGCSDLVIEDWDTTKKILKGNISQVEGVESLTEISITTMEVFSSTDIWIWDSYNIRFFTIHNITEYLQVVNLSKLEDGYSENDIEQLSTNLTYMMSRKYAKNNDFDKDAIFKTTMITSQLHEPYSMTYINSFKYYPLLPRTATSLIDIFTADKREFDLILSKTTTELLVNRSDNSVTKKGYLLINAKQDANLTNIKNEISKDFSFTAKTIDDVNVDLNESVSRFAQVFLIITSILTLLAVFFFGFISAINIYRQRLRIIESEFQIGAQRRQIWGSFTLEVLLVIPIPIAISMAIGIPIINLLSASVLNITEAFTKFVPWMPWWIILIISATGIIALVSSWLLKIIPLVKSYKPIKQE